MTFAEIDGMIYFAIQVVSFFMFTFVGAILKEIYDTNSSPNHEFSAYKVFCGTVVGTIVSIFIQEYYLNDQGWKLMIGISFLLGLVGSELFVKLSSVEMVEYLLEFFLHKKLPDLNHEEKKKEPEHEEIVEYKSPKVHIHLYHDEEEKN